MESHEVDVLIIGAGIQGAWLLREAVKRNLNAILIGKLDHAGKSKTTLCKTIKIKIRS